MKVTSITIGYSEKRVVNYQSVEQNMTVTVELGENEKASDAIAKYQPALKQHVTETTWNEAQRLFDEAATLSNGRR